MLQTTGLLKFQGHEIGVKRGGRVTEISYCIILDRDCRIRVSDTSDTKTDDDSPGSRACSEGWIDFMCMCII